MSKYMRPRNRPNFNTESELTQNGGGPAGELLGSAPKGNETGPPGASMVVVRGFFAPGTAASAAAVPGGYGGPPADVAELAAPLGCPGCAAGLAAVEFAASPPAAGLGTEASSRPGTAAAGPAVEPDAQLARRGHSAVGRRVHVPVDVARANPFTPPPDGTAAPWR